MRHRAGGARVSWQHGRFRTTRRPEMSEQTSRAVRIHAVGGPEQLVVDTVSVGDPRPGPGAHPPPRRRPELHRRLPAHRPVRLPPAAGTGHGRGGRDRGGGRGRDAPQGGRPRGLRGQPARQLLRRARDAGDERVQAARRDRLRDRRGHDAQGPDRAVPAQAHPPGGRAGGGRLRAVPRGRRWRGPDCLPVGQVARPATDRPPRVRTRSARWRWSTARAMPSTTAARTSPPASRTSPTARA